MLFRSIPAVRHHYIAFSLPAGIYFPGYLKEFPGQFWHGPAVCEQAKLTDMCELVTKSVDLFTTAFAGSFLIVVSLVSLYGSLILEREGRREGGRVGLQV